MPAQLPPVRRSSFSSDDETEVTAFIRQTYAENRSRFAPIRYGAHFSATTHDTPWLGGDRVRTSIDYGGTSDEGFPYYLFFVVHAGSVRVRSHGTDVTASRGDVASYPLGVPIDFTMRQFDVTTLRLPADRLHRVAEAASGVPAAEVRFHAITPVTAAMHRYWRSLTGTILGSLSDPDSPLGAPLVAEDMARTAITAALHTFPNTALDALTDPHRRGPGGAAPSTVRRAVDYIDAHADEPIGLTEIAAAAGVSARGLQHAFARHRDTSPIAYLRTVRLERAHRDLLAEDPADGTTVAAIATRWGFRHHGRFSAEYSRRFGESPRHTLRR